MKSKNKEKELPLLTLRALVVTLLVVIALSVLGGSGVIGGQQDMPIYAVEEMIAQGAE